MRPGAGLALVALIVAGCDREERDFRPAPPTASPDDMVQVGELEAGPATADTAWTVYEENRWGVAEGQRLFSWYNCVGCHGSAGGGGIGPALSDSVWIYGSAPQNVFATIVQGRPDGMPSFRGRIGNDDAWKLVAFVRSLARLTPPDSWPARADGMSDANPRRRDPGMPP